MEGPGLCVGHDFSNGGAVFGEPRHGPVQDPYGDRGGLVGQYLDIGQSGRVVDGAWTASPPAGCAGLVRSPRLAYPGRRTVQGS
jgi:hypothetical protein